MVGQLSRHWLALVTLAIALFLGLAFAAPLLDMGGHHTAAGAIYLVYRLACHQLPQRSWFLGGRAATVDWPTVQAYFGWQVDNQWLAFHQVIRDPVLGYQVAMCQRDVATFGGLLASALAVGALRRRGRVRPLAVRYFLLAGLPMAVDGISQLVGLRESTPLLRTATGALLGAATGLLLLPMVDDGLGAAGVPGGSDRPHPDPTPYPASEVD
jgi:uncharacterized membrane protein